MARKTKTISVPEDLLGRMADHPEENWSGVAVRAFEARLSQLQGQLQGRESPVDQIVRRFVAERSSALGLHVQKGMADGRYWAETAAEPEQLRRLYCIDLRRSTGDEESGSLAHDFVRGVDPERCRVDGDEDSFWVKHSRGSAPTDKYVKGFEEGARGVIAKVRRRLRQKQRCPGCGGPARSLYTSWIGLGPGGPQEPTIARSRMTCVSECGEADWHHPSQDDFYENDLP